MATTEQITELREKIGDTVEPYEYADEQLAAIIDNANGDTNAAAASVWRSKQVKYFTVTDITEAGSSRKNSVLYQRAKEMAEWYGGDDGGVPDDLADRPRTRAIIRPQ